jgi:hypothetical protein
LNLIASRETITPINRAADTIIINSAGIATIGIKPSIGMNTEAPSRANPTQNQISDRLARGDRMLRCRLRSGDFVSLRSAAVVSSSIRDFAKAQTESLVCFEVK